MPNHPLWPELSRLIVEYGGNLATLVRDMIDWAERTFSCPGAATRIL